MSYWQGFNVKCRISTAPAYVVTVKKVTISETLDELEVTNSEGIPGNPGAPNNATIPWPVTGITQGNQQWYKSMLNGPGQAEVTLEQPSFNNSEDPFPLPRGLQLANFINNFYVYKTNVLSAPFWLFYSLLITNPEDVMDVNGLQPYTIRMKSDGYYLRPT